MAEWALVYSAAVGREWVPMRVRAGVTEQDLARRIAAQRVSLRATGWHPDGDGATAEHAEAAWRRADEDLREVVDLLEDGAGRPSFRVGVIGANPLLPPSWRDAAWSSLSPAQARAELARWRWWYAEITAGRMRSYLDRLRLSDQTRELAAYQRESLGVVAVAAARPVARAASPAFLAARDRLAGLPSPPPAADPGPVPTGDEGVFPADLRQAWEGLRAHRRLLAGAVVEVNRTGPRSLRLSLPPRVGEPAGEVRDLWLAEFFTWAAPYLSDGCGLYLWA